MLVGSNCWAEKLKRLAPIGPDDEAHLGSLLATTELYSPGDEIVRVGERQSALPVLVEGFMCRVRHLEGGARQITGYLVPGDTCDVHGFVLDGSDHAVHAVTACRVAMIPEEAVHSMLRERPHLARALWRSAMVDVAILREWIVGLGRRDAVQRMAHFLCEMYERLQAVGLAGSDRFDLPLTQKMLADTLGLSTVHVNRTLNKLRGDGLIRTGGAKVEVLDAAGLCATAGFAAHYLHRRAETL